MGTYNSIDVTVSASGDIDLAPNGDLNVAMGNDILKQDIAFRVRTNPGEFLVHKDVGAGMDDLIGEPNTKENAKLGESKISHSLVYDGYIRNTDLYVRGVPVNNESVYYYVFVNNGVGQVNVSPDVIFTQIAGLTNLPGA